MCRIMLIISEFQIYRFYNLAGVLPIVITKYKFFQNLCKKIWKNN